MPEWLPTVSIASQMSAGLSTSVEACVDFNECEDDCSDYDKGKKKKHLTFVFCFYCHQNYEK